MPDKNDEKVKKVSKNEVVYTKDTRYPRDHSVMQNRMIEAWNSMSIDEKRIFILASPVVRLCDATEKTRFSISAKDYAEACQIGIASAYSQLKSAADNLRGRYFSYINAKGKRVSVHWVIRIEYDEAEISFHFPDEVLFMLSEFNAENAYTKFEIQTALKLRGSHALQLYQLLKQHEKIGYREFTVLQFRQFFELTEKYSIISNLRIRVIEPAVAEISEQTDLHVSFSQVHTGKAITGFRFNILSKSKFKKQITTKSKDEKKPKINNITALKVFNMLLKNSLIDEYKKHGESIEDIKSRIAQDFKSSKEEIWIERLQEKGLISVDCPF